jgi:peptidoglycan/xylan/chitin deacetylase (PgdA/CDA1 family)
MMPGNVFSLGKHTRQLMRPAAAATALVAIAAVLALASGGASRGPHRRVMIASRASTAAALFAWRPSAAVRPARVGPRGSAAELSRLIAAGKPIYCGGHRGREVALTFDDGPGPYTRLVLAKLRKHHMRATFFVVGRNVGLVPGAVKSERALGAVGDHTFSHPLLPALSPAEATAEIARTKLLLDHVSGAPVLLFRPPYGARTATIDAIARAHHLLEVLWSIDSRDSLGADWSQIEETVTRGLEPGAIVLMHENRGQTVRALLGIFAALERKRLRAVSVPELLTSDPPKQARMGSPAACQGR